MSGIFNLPAINPVERGDELELVEGNTSLDFLQAIYRSPDQPLNVRMRAAVAALPFEHPKLSVNANLGGNVGYARGLERAIKIVQERKLSRGEPLIIDGDAERTTPNTNG